jgi:DNA replication protein DnaC
MDIFEFKSCSKCENGFIKKKYGYIPCQCRLEYIENIRLYYRFLKANLIYNESNNKNFYDLINFNIDSYRGLDKKENIHKIKKFIKDFETKYTDLMLFFSGDPGTQKTTLAKYIITKLLLKDKTAYYTQANNLIQLIISAERNIDDKELLNYILGVSFLVIDEFDEDKMITYESGWQRKHFHPWLKERLEIIKKSTLFISNKNINNLGKYFDKATNDLIYRVVLDKNMIFEDVYENFKEPINLNLIWR